MSLVTKRGLRNTFHRGVEVRFLIDDRGILAAHLQHRALDPDLAGNALGGRLADEQAHFLGAGKRDVARFRMPDDRVAGNFTQSGDKIEGFFRNSRFVKNLDNSCGDRRRLFRGL